MDDILILLLAIMIMQQDLPLDKWPLGAGGYDVKRALAAGGKPEDGVVGKLCGVDGWLLLLLPLLSSVPVLPRDPRSLPPPP